MIYYKHEKHPDSILVRDFKGIINAENCIELWEEMINKRFITEKMIGTITNFTDCDPQFNFDSFQMILDYLKSKEILRKLKFAIICHNPEIIVFPTMAEFSEKEINVKPFTTADASINWIYRT